MERDVIKQFVGAEYSAINKHGLGWTIENKSLRMVDLSARRRKTFAMV